jgi:hypothetical protein
MAFQNEAVSAILCLPKLILSQLTKLKAMVSGLSCKNIIGLNLNCFLK